MKKLIETFAVAEVKVIFHPLRTCSGALLLRGKWFCFINSLDIVERQRFTLAHELAHFKFHRHLGDCFTDYGSNSQLEREANKWAAEYLMPAALVFLAYDVFKKYHRLSAENLASYFGVSKKAMEIRLNELGLGKEVKK